MTSVWLYSGAVLMAAILDIFANMLLARSEGFKRKGLGLGALTLVALAFTCLALAVRGLDLSVAYALWGGLGIIGTGLGGWLLLGQKLRPMAWLGLAMLLGGIVLLHLD
ncbi:ligand-binding protein SH3 [Desulfovibrio sp. OttesenSCG-928-C14]|nr:ligand-binding protein SH3 [Desulfovibrio sp. OttesenSCG-928-C14]